MPQYQGVWTLEQQAQAQSNQQWVTDPNFKNTTLLLQADGTGSGSQNQTFLDGSTNNFFITRNGNTTQGSFSPFSQAPGYWGNYFDGNASCDLQTPSDAAFGYGTGDFSLEAWVYQQTNANARIIDHTDDNFNFGVQSNGVVNFFSSATSYTTATGLVALNTWTHICATRQGSTLRIFVNGVLRYNTTFTNSKGTSAVNIGSNPGGGGETLNGYISNMRIVKGGVPSAYSTSSTTNGTVVFNPSTSPFVLSESLTAGSVSLLTCQSNRFLDNSSNAFAISVTAGTPSVQAFGPFAPALQWTPDVVGGSGYFDGSDSLTTPSSSAFAFSGNFTVEAWVYLTANLGASTGGYLTDFRTGSTSNFALGFIGSSGNKMYCYVNGADVTGTTAVPLNCWNHVAYVRSGSTVTLYLNGVANGTISTSFSQGTTSVRICSQYGGSVEFITGYVGSVSVNNTTAIYTSSFIPPTLPTTAVSGTQLLLNYTNAGIYDGKMANNLETVGNAQVSTSVVKYGSGSMAFDGTGDNLLIPNSPIYDFGTGDFTIEGWVYVTTQATGSQETFIGRSVASGASFHIALTTGGVWVYYLSSNNSSWNIASAVTIGTNTLGVWQHIALVRTGNLFTPYLNGIAGTTTTSALAIYWNSSSAAANCITVGGTENLAGTQNLYGYIDDLRITRAARYFTRFTPPQQALPRQ